MSTLNFTVNVPASLINKLEEMGRGDAVKKAIAESTAFAEKTASQKAPFDTGHLADSIQSEITNNGYSSRIYTDVEYGIYQELGTIHMASHPFMKPTAIETQNKLWSDMQRYFK
jgi:HK97 gp10 family phage protein